MKMLPDSPTVAIDALAKSKQARGEKVFNFAAGDPALDNHPCIMEGAVKASRMSRSPYPPITGLPKLRELLAHWLNVTCGTDYTRDQVVVTCGGKFALFAAINSWVSPGDEVLIPSPYWVSYPEIVKGVGGTPVFVSSEARSAWKVSAADLEGCLTERSKVLILNNASNPTGALYSRQEVQDILEVAAKAGLRVISDEVYSGLVYDGTFVSCGSFPEHGERVVIIQSCSKSFGMTGWRVGFAVGSEDIVRRIAALQSQSTTGTAWISQWVAVAALENASVVNAYVKEAMRRRRDLFVRLLGAMTSETLQIPSALYAFVPVQALGYLEEDSIAVASRLLSQHAVAVVPGVAFGVERYVRFAFSEAEENIVEGLGRLRGELV